MKVFVMPKNCKFRDSADAWPSWPSQNSPTVLHEAGNSLIHLPNLQDIQRIKANQFLSKQ